MKHANLIVIAIPERRVRYASYDAGFKMHILASSRLVAGCDAKAWVGALGKLETVLIESPSHGKPALVIMIGIAFLDMDVSSIALHA